MNLPTISPEETRTRLQSGDGYVYLDVRTVEEFEEGRPPGAFNVPIVIRNPATGQPQANDDFLKVVEAHFPRDARLIVGCRTTNRSAHATALLLQTGFQNVSNMTGGFAGVQDGTGRVVQPGWSTLNFPTETGPGGEGSYETLTQRGGE